MKLSPAIYYDLRAIKERDPAIRGLFWPLEVLFFNTGFQAVLAFRLAHFLRRLYLPLLPKLTSYLAKIWTGIDIHPGAALGRGFFIDHGVGTVIGETTVTGRDCTLFQGVTLGGTGKKQGKRHPTLGDGVVVGAGAKILGDIYIADGVKVGANSVVLKDIPPHATVVGIPGRIAKQGAKSVDLEHGDIVDPMEELIAYVQNDVTKLQKALQKIRENMEESEREMQQSHMDYFL